MGLAWTGGLSLRKRCPEAGQPWGKVLRFSMFLHPICKFESAGKRVQAEPATSQHGGDTAKHSMARA